MNMTFALSYKEYSDEFYVSSGDAEWEIEDAIANTLSSFYPDQEDWEDYILKLGKENISTWAAAVLAEADDDIVTALLNEMSAEEVASTIKDCRYAEHRSGGEYAEDYFDSIYGEKSIPDMLRGHIDWQAVFDCEMRYDGNYATLTEYGTSNRIVVYWE